MLANRGSPSRALRTVINALQHVAPPPPAQQQRASSAALPPRLTSRWSGHLDDASAASSEATAASQSPRGGGRFGKDAPIREFKKLYGLIKYRSRKDIGVVPVDDAPSPNGRGSDDASSEKDR
uniref:Uncharacterized protein n=1 Tax=Arundo donax TaxID=35708 RepID=A0A0A9EHR8_ARUDO